MSKSKFIRELEEDLKAHMSDEFYIRMYLEIRHGKRLERPITAEMR